MILESLLELVETLKERIDAHGDLLRQSEALTRYALIDPLLRELGWDTEDPKLVRPEYPLRSEYAQSTRFADYALLEGTDDKPVMMIEAKSLGRSLRDQALLQGINYCQAEGTKYFTVSDGQRWEVYETHRPVPIDEKRVVEFDLRNQESAEVCLKVLALWRPSVQSGNVAAGHESVVGSPEDSPVVPPPPITASPTPPPPPPPPDSEPLTEITEATGRKVAEMVFPDGSRTPLENWSFLPVEAVRWLMTSGMLKVNDCPIMGSYGRTSKYSVHTKPVHSDGISSFTTPRKVNGLYVEGFGNAKGLMARTRFIIERAGQDPSQFGIRFS